jgi:cytochrome c-type protein NapB
MAEPEATGGDTPLRLLAIVGAVAVMLTLVLTLGTHVAGPDHAPPEPLPAGPPDGSPIAAEADVFRTRPEMLGVGHDMARRTQAHLRTLAMFRSLRAYPGAPPRIPHGLTAEEFRGTVCNSCHERGAFVARLSSYAPVTPHPEFTDCLQCHLPDDRVVGIPMPDGDPNSVCLQCHLADPTPPLLVPLDWQAAPWPSTGQAALADGPPLIPHDLQLRGNCLACHIGPAAVEEIRTQHAERANCRQCHLAAAEAARPPAVGDAFTRTLDGAPTPPGGAS